MIEEDWIGLAMVAAIHHTACFLENIAIGDERRRKFWSCGEKNDKIKSQSKDFEEDKVTVFMRQTQIGRAHV